MGPDVGGRSARERLGRQRVGLCCGTRPSQEMRTSSPRTSRHNNGPCRVRRPACERELGQGGQGVAGGGASLSVGVRADAERVLCDLQLPGSVGDRLVSGSTCGTITVWDLATGSIPWAYQLCYRWDCEIMVDGDKEMRPDGAGVCCRKQSVDQLAGRERVYSGGGVVRPSAPGLGGVH